MKKWCTICKCSKEAKVTWKAKDTLQVECEKVKDCNFDNRRSRHVQFINFAQTFPPTFYYINNDKFEALYKVK